MPRILLVLCSLIFIAWLCDFNAEEYQTRWEAKHWSGNSPAPSPETEGAPLESEHQPDLLFPLAGKSLRDVISGYGDTREQGKRIHEGIDIPAERGTPVLAVADGRIAKVANQGGGGKQVWLQVGTRQYFYAHLDSWTVRQGQTVKQGTILGTVGNSGNAQHTSPHLHFGVYVDRHKTIDPARIFPEQP